MTLQISDCRLQIDCRLDVDCQCNLQSAFCNLQCHESGTDCPASTQTYSHAKLPASASTAAAASGIGWSLPASARTTAATIETRIAPPQNRRAKAPRRIADTASSWWRVGLDAMRFSKTTNPRCSTVAPMSTRASVPVTAGSLMPGAN